MALIMKTRFEGVQAIRNIEKLTRDILIELVDHIKVYEGGNISIVFRFADELRRIQEFIEVNNPSEAVRKDRVFIGSTLSL